MALQFREKAMVVFRAHS